MTELRNVDTDTLITMFVSMKQKQEVIRTIHKALDGSERVSRFGQPIINYDLTAYVKDAGRLLLMAMEDDLSLLSVNLKAGLFFGRIIKLGEFERISEEYYKVDITLTKENES